MFEGVPAKKNKVDVDSLHGIKLIKEVNRRIRVAMKLWDAHRNAACRREREQALQLYQRLSEDEKTKVPQELRVWLRYRSEKYFGEGRDGHGANSGNGRKKSGKAPSSTSSDDDEWP